MLLVCNNICVLLNSNLEISLGSGNGSFYCEKLKPPCFDVLTINMSFLLLLLNSIT